MSGGEPSSIKRIFPCAAKVAVFELAAQVTDIRRVQMWVCDLVMSRSVYSEVSLERPANKSQVEISEIFSEKWVHQFKPLGVSF